MSLVGWWIPVCVCGVCGLWVAPCGGGVWMWGMKTVFYLRSFHRPPWYLFFESVVFIGRCPLLG